MRNEYKNNRGKFVKKYFLTHPQIRKIVRLNLIGQFYEFSLFFVF